MLETCTLAVLVLMNNAEPISPLERPSATSCSTSISRGVSPAAGPLLRRRSDHETGPLGAARRSGRPARVEPMAIASADAVAKTCLASLRSRPANEVLGQPQSGQRPQMRRCLQRR